MNREIKERVKSIIYTVVFLIGMTWFWYGPREEIATMSADLNGYIIHKDVTLSCNGELKLNNKDYKFELKNEKKYEVDYEIMINNDVRKQRNKNCKLVSNNYLSYQLKIGNAYNIARNLSISGIIYRGVLGPNETKKYSIKMKLDGKVKEADECFFPVVKIATYKKI